MGTKPSVTLAKYVDPNDIDAPAINNNLLVSDNSHGSVSSLIYNHVLADRYSNIASALAALAQFPELIKNLF